MRNNRKKHGIIFILLAVTCFLIGCGARIQLPENPIVYGRGSNGEYVYLTEGDRIYVPYCAFEPDRLGDCIGYCDVEATEYSGAFREYICELKGYPSDEWIVGVMNAGCTEGMILREVNATDIPEGFSSEYEWNQLEDSSVFDGNLPAITK